jgi:ketosteroid isomerase-like protein
MRACACAMRRMKSRYRVKAVRDKDARAAVTRTAADIVVFDVVNPLQRSGADDAERRAAEWFASFEGPIGFEVRELTIAAGGGVAFSHALHRYGGMRAD